MQIKNVIFDLGKVLIDFDFSSFWQSIGARIDESFLDMAEEPILLFEAGKISRSDFFEDMKKVYSFELPLTKFEELWCNVFSPMDDMIGLAKEISKKYNVYILSNTDEIHFPYIWKNYPSLHFFKNNLMLSYELDSVKPEEDIYKNALKRFDLNPQECVMIDDRPVNALAAEKMGMRGITHRTCEETKEKLYKILTLHKGFYKLF